MSCNAEGRRFRETAPARVPSQGQGPQRTRAERHLLTPAARLLPPQTEFRTGGTGRRRSENELPPERELPLVFSRAHSYLGAVTGAWVRAKSTVRGIRLVDEGRGKGRQELE